MARSMTKAKIVATLAEQLEIPKKLSAAYLEALAALAYKEARHGFPVPGLGKLVVTKSQARMYRNPRTGKPMQVRAKKRVRFRVSKVASDAILGGR
jgi:DNA-binding protein HU-beta